MQVAGHCSVGMFDENIIFLQVKTVVILKFFAHGDDYSGTGGGDFIAYLT